MGKYQTCKGLNIPLVGKAKKEMGGTLSSSHYAVKPTDFFHLTPRLRVKEGDAVKAGTVLFYDKYTPEIQYASPVSGTVCKIERGERRKLLAVVIEADQKGEYEDVQTVSLDESREAIVEKLCNAGLWPYIKQRAFNLVARPSDTPRDIFISGFDTAPNAPDYQYIFEQNDKTQEEFQAGVHLLGKLTNGLVYLGTDADQTSTLYNSLEGVELNQFKGKHPIGNVGIQINKVRPINKGEAVWTVAPQDVLIIGRFLLTGKYDAKKIFALTGEVNNPQYYETISGVCVSDFLKDKLQEDNVRVVSGNVLSGSSIGKDGFLGFYDAQISVLPEGDQYELFGWMKPGLDKFSASKTYLSGFRPREAYHFNTNMNGEERAFVLVGEYEKVFPMDIYPVHLLKACLAKDMTKIENLGIYEVIPEDMALCEFVCASKIRVQKILEETMLFLMKELAIK